RLESHRDWLSTPLSMSGQNLPCPPPTTIRFYHSLCQVSARRRSPPHSTAAGSVPMGEWRGGVSPPRSHRTGREPLSSSGSQYPAASHAEASSARRALGRS